MLGDFEFGGGGGVTILGNFELGEFWGILDGGRYYPRGGFWMGRPILGRYWGILDGEGGGGVLSQDVRDTSGRYWEE